jgi:hypothetical protein
LKFISLPLISLLQIAWRRERLAFRFCPLAETPQGTLNCYRASIGVPLNGWKRGKFALVAFAGNSHGTRNFGFPFFPFGAGPAALRN